MLQHQAHTQGVLLQLAVAQVVLEEALKEKLAVQVVVARQTTEVAPAVLVLLGKEMVAVVGMIIMPPLVAVAVRVQFVLLHLQDFPEEVAQALPLQLLEHL